MSHVGAWPARSYSRGALIFLLSAAAVCAFFLAPIARIAAVALLGGLFVLYLIATTLDGRIDVPLLFWVAIFPLGYYLSFLLREPLITLDRIVIVVLLMGMCLASGRKTIMLPKELRRSAVAWGCFLLVALASAEKAKDPLSSVRASFDGFILPALLGWCIIRNFDVRRHLITLHAMVCTMAVYVAALGAVEMRTGTDLLPLQDGGLYFAGSILRPNGPFSSINSFALIGLISFFFLLFLRRTIGEQLPWWQRLLHTAGLACALATALMPMFRSVGVTLLIILLLDMYFNRRVGRMLAQLAVLTSVIGGLAVFSAKLPDAFEDRSHEGNFYSRIAQQRQTFELFKMHPLTGLGIANFENVAEAQGQSVGFYKGFESGNSPHNNLGAILAETGLMGFLPYVAAQVLLIAAFSQLYTVERRHSRAVWISFLYVFLSYWVSGLSLTSGYYSDLNLWYMFVMMVIYKFAITESKNPCVERRPELPDYSTKSSEYFSIEAATRALRS